MSSYAMAKKAIGKPWVSLHMDGRNEHGTHLIPVPPYGLCLHEEETDGILSCQEQVERIFSKAEQLGYRAGCAIVVLCTVVEDDFGFSFELEDVDNCLTELIHGSVEEQNMGFGYMVLK